MLELSMDSLLDYLLTDAGLLEDLIWIRVSKVFLSKYRRAITNSKIEFMPDDIVFWPFPGGCEMVLLVFREEVGGYVYLATFRGLRYPDPRNRGDQSLIELDESLFHSIRFPNIRIGLQDSEGEVEIPVSPHVLLRLMQY